MIIVGLALAASVAIGGVLGYLSGDNGDEPETTRPALSAPTGTPQVTEDAGTPTAPASTTPVSPVVSPASTAVATPATPDSPAASPVATPATPAATPAN
ncbi:MAG: hypothetical protein ACRDJW_18390 [Thermomicrobiales bacterium]